MQHQLWSFRQNCERIMDFLKFQLDFSSQQHNRRTLTFSNHSCWSSRLRCWCFLLSTAYHQRRYLNGYLIKTLEKAFLVFSSEAIKGAEWVWALLIRTHEHLLHVTLLSRVQVWFRERFGREFAQVGQTAGTQLHGTQYTEENTSFNKHMETEAGTLTYRMVKSYWKHKKS